MTGRPGDGRQIFIIGVAGSGKTTLAIAIGARIGIPAVHLDNVADAAGQADPSVLHAPLGEFPDHAFVPRPLEERRRMTESIAAAPAWVAEGAFIEWTDALLASADTIVWLDHQRLRDTVVAVVGRARRSMGRPAEPAAASAPALASEGSHEAGRVNPVRRLAAMGRHAIELLLEIRDVVAYYWRTNPPGVARDVAAGRWDRLTRAQVAEALRPYADRVVRTRHVSERDGLAERIAAGPASDPRRGTGDQAAGSPPTASR